VCNFFILAFLKTIFTNRQGRQANSWHDQSLRVHKDGNLYVYIRVLIRLAFYMFYRLLTSFYL
jgi:hypothetical protein